jgi:hypothetical protein
MRTNESSSTSKNPNKKKISIRISFFKNAINCPADECGIQYLKRYYCQLQLLRNRFPMLPETECAVRFTW